MLLKENSKFKDKAQISYDILTYLTEHPEAQDTFDGIVEWWLPEQIIKQMRNRSKPLVQEAVDSLVKRKLIIVNKGADSHTHYRINRRNSKKIHEILGQLSNEIKENINAESI